MKRHRDQIVVSIHTLVISTKIVRWKYIFGKYISRAKWRNIFVTVIFDGLRQALILVAAKPEAVRVGWPAANGVVAYVGTDWGENSGRLKTSTNTNSTVAWVRFGEDIQ